MPLLENVLLKTDLEVAHSLIKKVLDLFSSVLERITLNRDLVPNLAPEVFEALMAMDHLMRKTYEIFDSSFYLEYLLEWTAESLHSLVVSQQD